MISSQTNEAPLPTIQQLSEREQIEAVLQQLSERERQVLQLRYGLKDGRPTRVDIPTLERLCKALECRIEDILEQTEEWRAARIAGGQPNTIRAALS